MPVRLQPIGHNPQQEVFRQVRWGAPAQPRLRSPGWNSKRLDDHPLARLAADPDGGSRQPDIEDKLLKGHQAGGKTFKVHLDGYNQLSYLTGQQPRSARKEFFYFNDDGDLVAMRYENWKVVFPRLATISQWLR